MKKGKFINLVGIFLVLFSSVLLVLYFTDSFGVLTGLVTVTPVNVSIVVTNASNETTPDPPPPDSPGGGGGTKLISLNIILPNGASMNLDDKVVVIPFILEVPEWATDFSDITLSAESNTLGLDVSLDLTSLDSLKAGETQMLNLIVENTGLAPVGDYEIDIFFVSERPIFEDSAKLLFRLDDREVEGGDIVDRIKLVEDYLNLNPECLEYMTYVLEAEKRLNSGDLMGAKDLLQVAMLKCKDTLEQVQLEPAGEGRLRFWNVLFYPVFWLLLLLLIILLILMWLERRRRKKKYLSKYGKRKDSKLAALFSPSKRSAKRRFSKKKKKSPFE